MRAHTHTQIVHFLSGNVPISILSPIRKIPYFLLKKKIKEKKVLVTDRSERKSFGFINSQKHHGFNPKAVVLFVFSKRADPGVMVSAGNPSVIGNLW